MKPPLGKLHIIADTVELAEAAIAGGADTIQYRDKTATTRTMIKNARAILDICRSAGVTLIVNDRVDIAMAIDADGVHLGQNDLPIAVARKLLGSSKLIGGSASTFYEALRVEREAADYMGCGHIFSTESKPKPYPARGVAFLGEVCKSVRIPVVAIGGINPARAGEVMASGAFGVAVIDAVRNAVNPQEVTRSLSGIVRGR